ncbi:MAG: N-acetylmuramoyl-L-alanine amidase [Clostridium sp.]
MSKTIALDIGHNTRFDTGAVGIRNEDELNLLVGSRVLEKLRGCNINVVDCTPKSSSSLTNSLQTRCNIANSNNADIFISIHHNACPGGHGSEGLCIKGGIAERTGIAILEELSSLGLRNRGIKERRDLYVIKHTVMPALIVECAFVDSPKDMNDYDPIRVGDAIFKGIVRALGLSQAVTEEFYVVNPGDTLFGIARKFNTTVERLVALNGIKDRNLIKVGQKIRTV